MPKNKLTIAKIQSVRIPDGQAEIRLWDAAVNGLHLRCAAGGARTWSFRYRAGGGRKAKIRTLKIGAYPAVSIDAARTAAQGYAAIVAQGADPAEQRQEKRRAERSTLGALLAVGGPYERALKARGIVKAKEALSSLRRGLTRLMHMDIDQVSRRDLVEALDALDHLPGAQNELRKCTRSLLEWSTNSGLTRANVLAGMRRPPLTRTQKIEQAAKRRALDDNEIVAFWNAAGRCGRFGSLMRLGLLTGMRRGELANLRWSDIAADRIVLAAERTKMTVQHEIPLTPLMRKILVYQVRTTSPLVFPSDTTGEAMTGWVKMKAKLVREADIGPFTIHDMRRSCRTAMTRLGVSKDSAELAIGHAPESLVAIYALDKQWSMRLDAFSRVSDHVAGLIEHGEIIMRPKP
jgi:integrase